MEPENNKVATIEPKKSLVMLMADDYNMQPEHFLDAVKQTCMSSKDITVTNGLLAAFLMVAHEYKLNPLIREIFAFPTKSGGIQPIVSIDGWVKLITTHPKYAGMELSMELDEKKQKPISCTCQLFRTDGIKIPAITEYYDECYRNTDPWNKMPKRMMRHKAIKEAGRVAFGFGGLMDQDEGIDAINITEQSTVLERSTNSAKEELKEKIGAKKGSKTAPAPATPELPQQSIPESPANAQPPAQPANNAPESTVITPQPISQDQPVVNMSEELRKAFLNKAEEKANDLGYDTETTKAKMRELVFSFGQTKYINIPADQFEATLRKLDEWKKIEQNSDI